VSGGQLGGFAPGPQAPHIKDTVVASRWQRARGLIGSGFEPRTSRTKKF